MPGSQTLSPWMVFFHSLDKSLASYKLSSWFLFTFWAADERVQTLGVHIHVKDLESCFMLVVLLIEQQLGLVHFLYLIKKEDIVGNNLLFLFVCFWDSLPHFQTAEIDFQHL